MRHAWSYGKSDAKNSRSRYCAQCWATGRRYGRNSTVWDTFRPSGAFYGTRRVPPCPGTPWVRFAESAGPEWRLFDRETHAVMRRVNGGLVAQFGREHVEQLLARTPGVPPLPEAAWEELA